VVISAIGGTAGVGKTALAVYWAHRVADRFPDGQLYVNLRGFDPGGSVMDPAEVVRRFLHALGVEPQRLPADLDAQVALYRSYLAGRRMLVVLDNARDTAQVRPLLPGAPTCLVLVTSRNQLSGLVAADGAHPITLDLLLLEEARELLTRRLGADRVAAEPDAVAEIIVHCARLPLALAIVAARAATHPHRPLHTLASEMRETRDRLDMLTTDDPHTDVRAVFSWSYQALTPEAARLFRLLGLHPGPGISAPAAASLAALPVSRVRPLLAELAGAHLIVEPTPGRYTFHDLLRAYAVEQAHAFDPDQQRHTATHRALDHYLHTAHTAAVLLEPARDLITLTTPQPGVTPEHPADHQQALAWFAAEHAVLLAAVDHAAGEFDTHTQLRHALDLHRQTGDRTGQAHTYLNLARLRERQGHYAEALDHARQALDPYRAAGDRRGQANALNAVGWLNALLGDHQQALTACQRALTLHQELDDHYGQADTWDSLGYAHHHLGRHAEAIACYQRALARSVPGPRLPLRRSRDPHQPRRHPPRRQRPRRCPRRPCGRLGAPRIEAEPRTVDHIAGDSTTNVRAVFSWSYRTLTTDAARLVDVVWRARLGAAPFRGYWTKQFSLFFCCCSLNAAIHGLVVSRMSPPL
jgi:tetratricopeptide (TPR) repeat protein